MTVVQALLPAPPATCERTDCDEPVAFVKRYDLIGATWPAFSCARHRRKHWTDVPVETLDDYEQARRAQ